MKKISLLSIIYLFNFGICLAQDLDSLQFNSRHFKNLFQINDSIYRSEQPSKKAFKELESYGFKTIVNLRRLQTDRKKARETKLNLIDIPLKSKTITEADILIVLKTINNSEKPLLIHCWHGSDRTGVVAAAFRVIFEDWSKEKAIAEFRKKEFGYHERWYPNLIGILENMDVEVIRQELRLK